MKTVLSLLLVCGLASAAVSSSAIISAMREALEGQQVEIDIVDHSRNSPCDGSPQFNRSDLLPALDADPARIVYWRGRMVCEDGRSMQIWARARLIVEQLVVVAKHSIAAGYELSEADLEARTVRRALTGPPALPDAAKLIGHITTRSVAAGQAVRKEWLKIRPEVARGGDVSVRVVAGRARLTLQGRAESSGSIGQQVFVKNPATGKTFRAVVEGVNSVWVRGS
jgi:flagella basal body P-ring formation protein FlgA